MCFELDSLPPIPPIEGGAIDHRDLVLEAPTGIDSPPSPRFRTSRRDTAWLSCPTSGACTASTRSSRFASPSGGLPRSRSTTSAARPARRSAATTSSTWSTSRRRRPRGSRPTCALGSSTCARRAAVDLHGRLLLRRAQLVALGGRRARPGRGGRLLRAPGRARTAQPGPTQRAGEIDAPILALQAGDDQNIPAEVNAAFDAALAAAGRRARGRHLPGRAAQLLRPPLRGVRRRVGGRVAAGARVHRALRRLARRLPGSRSGPFRVRPGSRRER